MTTVLRRGSQIAVYANPITGVIINASEDPSWVPPADCMATLVRNERELSMRFPGHQFKVVGKGLEFKNKTVEEAFPNRPTDEDMKETLQVAEHTGKLAFIDMDQSNHNEELIFLFTRAALEATKASGVKEQSIKKAFCNGVGKAILTMYPNLGEKLKKIVLDAKNNDDMFESNDSLI